MENVAPMWPTGLWYLLEKRGITGRYVRWIWKPDQGYENPSKVKSMTDSISPALDILNAQKPSAPCTLGELLSALEQADAVPEVLTELGETYMHLKVDATGPVHGFALQYFGR